MCLLLQGEFKYSFSKKQFLSRLLSLFFSFVYHLEMTSLEQTVVNFQ